MQINKKRVLFVLKNYNDSSAQNTICVKGIVGYLKDDFEIDYLSCEFENKPTDKTNVYTFYVKKRSIFRTALKFFSFPVDKIVEKGFYKTIKHLLGINKYDAIIAVENPLEAVTSTLKAKKHFDFNYIVYEIDPASNRFKSQCSFFHKIWHKTCQCAKL